MPHDTRLQVPRSYTGAPNQLGEWGLEMSYASRVCASGMRIRHSNRVCKSSGLYREICVIRVCEYPVCCSCAMVQIQYVADPVAEC